MIFAVIFAGGVGSRMKRPDLPKQFLEINDTPILVHTIKHFQDNPEIDGIVVVMLSGYIERTWKLVKEYGLDKVKEVVPGGATGQESIYNGLSAVKGLVQGEDDIVLIHDGVRPIIEDDLIARNIAAVKKHRSSISCTPCKETVARIDENNNIVQTIERSRVWLARAPQSFFFKDIYAAHKKARADGKNDIVDSCTVMSLYSNIPLHKIETWAENIKVTTPDDFYTAEALISQLSQGSSCTKQ